ncbi:MAG TPA: tRNA (N6-threonylcarbamoyladenosine(37)-N6)-methyltransferase TrmO, partial [Marinobacter adhaerens]|nr:tRNA (N6-threonylcarbamoyladenosine(37)-N6)-methyltransferase TrmO [Marinobacter adhaerens]
MNDPCDMRPNEEAVALEPASDATLRFIGTIRTPWRDR